MSRYIFPVLTDQSDYTKTPNYWKYLKTKLKKENSQVLSATTQLKFLAPVKLSLFYPGPRLLIKTCSSADNFVHLHYEIYFEKGQ